MIHPITQYAVVLWNYKGRMPFKDLAQKLPLSARTIRRRFEFMRKKRLIVETILFNPVSIQKGLMVLFCVELAVLTNSIHQEIEKNLRMTLSDNYWISWRVADRPILLLGFQTANAQEIKRIREKLIDLLPTFHSISQFIGESIKYFPDFRDEILEDKKGKWFSPELWERS